MLPVQVRIVSLWVVLSLVLSSCSSGVFQGERGAQKAALEAMSKPPLEPADARHRPLPGPDTPLYNPPAPPIQPFSVSRTLFPQLAASSGVGALLVAPLSPEAAATPLAAPIGPAFNWSQTENFLVLGTDHRPGWSSWRTDVMMVVGIDRANARAAVFSIPRDLYVQIPGYGWGRVNQVDNIGEKASPGGGGPALVSQVLANTLGISTRHWVRVRMDGFVDLVDAVGGVTVHLDCAFFEPIYDLTTDQWDYFALPPGDIWLDGESAYWFVRLRYRESDIGRNQRQREFLWGLRNQVVRTNLVANFLPLYNAFQNMVTTDLNPIEIVDLLAWGIRLEPSNVRASGLTLADLQNYTTPQGAMVLRIADPERVRSIVEGIWGAPALADSYRRDTTQCPALPAGVTFVTDLPGDPAGGEAPLNVPPPAAAPLAGGDPAQPAAEAQSILLPTPTPAGGSGEG